MMISARPGGTIGMENEAMGHAVAEAAIENLEDRWAVRNGLKKSEDARVIVVPDALVDTGATLLSIPTRLIQQLGLRKAGAQRVNISRGTAEADMYEAVRLTIKGRSCTMDVLEVPDATPVLIGHIPLEHLDFVIDPRSQSLIGNPAHGGEHMYEMY